MIRQASQSEWPVRNLVSVKRVGVFLVPPALNVHYNRGMPGKHIMRKIYIVAIILLILSVAAGLEAIEVSEEQDIAIFGLTADDFAVPEELIIYTESSIANEFIQLKRFNVLGYENYRLGEEDVEAFIDRVRELQAEKAKEEGTYDEKFGTVVIKGEDFDRIVGSVLIVIPSVAEFNKSRVKIPIITEEIIRYVWKSEASITLDLTFVNVRTGAREESLRIHGTAQAQDMNRAATLAVDNAVSGLGHRLKQIETFKIRSGVVKVQGDRVFFELGSGIGVKVGHEYEVLTKQEIGKSGRTTQIPTGLVRVKTVYEDLSEAWIVYQKERITEGDQLVEMAKLGFGLGFYLGAMQVDIPDMDYDIYAVGDGAAWPNNDYYYMDFNQTAKDWVPAIGMTVEYSPGYRFQGIFDLQTFPTGSMWGFLGEFGAGSSFYKRRFGLQLRALLGFMYMTSFAQELGRGPGNPEYLDISGQRISFDQDPVMNIYGYSVGAKFGALVNYRVSRGSKIRLGVNYRVYTAIDNWHITIEESSGSDKNKVEITSDSSNIAGEGLKRVSLSGFEFIGGIVILF